MRSVDPGPSVVVFAGQVVQAGLRTMELPPLEKVPVLQIAHELPP